MSYSFFIDDTSTGAPRANYLPILGGIVVEDRFYCNILRQRYYSLKRNFGLSPSDPIKWSPGQSDQKYSAQRSLSRINDLREEVLKLISSPSITIIASIVDENLLNRAYERLFYMKQSIDHLAKRFHYMLSSSNLFDGKMILDYPGHNVESKLISWYRHIRLSSASSGVHLGTLSDSLYYSHCFANDGIQLADFVVGCIGFTLKHKRKHYFNLIKKRIRSVRGKTKGCGLIVFPSNSSSIDFLC
jgi:hypothetical protein